uniref:Methyltransferase domain-containing protein n=1 Tax=Hyaloperonospora arabidopsidis (strain Emoy2) TaxID=559515 RepID=M4C142_HYAAE
MTPKYWWPMRCSPDSHLVATRFSTESERRVAGEPVAYIIGWKEFWSMEFAVTRDTLIPRSDSEVLLETLVAQYHPQTPLHILDIGTGSGCLLLSALSEFPKATGLGIDISPSALDVARKNARSHKLDGRAEFLLRDLQTLPELENDDKVMYQRFDVILCNPPYIPRQELHLVGPDVLEYEPHVALFSGGEPSLGDCGMDLDPQGLRMYDFLHNSVGNLFRSHAETALAAEWDPERRKRPENHMKKNCLLMEIGSMGQAQAVQKLFASTAGSQSVRSATGDRSPLKFDRFLFDASGKYRGLLFS